MISLSELKLMAQGGQTQIFHYGEGKVLRVLRNPKDADLLKYEIYIMKGLKNRLDVPEVFDTMTIEGRPAVVVEKIDGISMLDYMKRHPLRLKEQAALLAKLHARMPDSVEIKGLGASKGRARYLIGQAELSEDTKKFVLEILEGLPEGTALCHGDFHPGNILKSGEKNYLIDWFGAYKGPLISDVAHTYLLLKNVPSYPGLGGVQYKLIKVSGALIAKTYLNAFHKLRPFGWAEFSKWLLIKAAERACYGMQAEKPAMFRFIKTCRADAFHPERWYKKM